MHKIKISLDFKPRHRDTSSVPEIAYLSLGSNLGDRAANLRTAIAQLEPAGRVLAVSGFYETQPIDVIDQPWFLNCVIAIQTEKTARDLLRLALTVEAAMGRVRLRKKGARNIDIDIVLFGDQVVNEPGLKIPHPAMHQRRFVLEPLVEIAPKARHPERAQSAQDLLASLPSAQTVRRL
jgi:2-amino-4-hydroxy-6-hydroxymethyldihydropteridine diphosphokinase